MKTIVLILTTMLALAAQSAHAIKISYTYDVAGRLNAVNYNGSSRTAYAYDKNGALLSRANTVNTPLPPLAGTYNGLATNVIPTEVDMGPITLKLSSNGSFSGKVTFGGVAYSFTGAFSASGACPAIVIDRKSPLSDYTLTLSLDVAGGSQRITGTISDTVFVSDVVMDRASYNTTTQLLPAGIAGKYTAILMPTEVAAAIPQGDGYATVSITPAGAITMAGKLANNVAITHSSNVVGFSSWPLFVSLNTNKGYLAGPVVFAGISGVSDFAGTLTWIKPITTGPFHPAGINTKLTCIGSKWIVPPAGQRVLTVAATSPNLTFTASQGNLGAPVTTQFTLDATNKFVVPATSAKIKLSLAATTGVVTGSFADGTATRTVGGVLFQDQNVGSGFFPGSTVSGLIQIEAGP